MKTFATLFSGGELFGAGARQAGYRHLWGMEYDDKIASVARLNGFDVRTADVREVEFSLLERPDHLHVSPPCPNFSIAKTGGVETPEDVDMAEAVCKAIQAIKPETFTLENVIAYRKSQSLARIITTLQNLGYMIDIQNLNAADFGVPQTRRRMILRASRLGLLRPYPQPVRWVGWYDAIEDILDTLPDSQFAPWQIARLPKEYKDYLVRQGTYSNPRDKNDPADTITANSNQSGVKAFLMESKFKDRNGKKFHKEPTPTVTALDPNLKAFLMSSGNNSFADAKEGKGVRYAEDPAHTMMVGKTEGKIKAFIVDGQSTSLVTVPDGDEPAFTMTSSADKFLPRAQIGRVVKMTTQALGRFQSVPDDYKGLTVRINGNGVPCLMARKIMETLL